MKKIIFTDMYNENGVLEKPKPSSQHLPDWYKVSKSYSSGEKDPSVNNNATIKKCMPILDMMTAGYMLTTPCDMYVKQVDGQPYYYWSEGAGKGGDLIAFQPIEQLQNHPGFLGEAAGTRLNHPWSIKTPKGWSVILMQPSHRESPFVVVPGIIDTDRYYLPTNTFFKLVNPYFEGLIPAGTIYAQIIPFKRAKWISFLGGKKEKNKYTQIKQKMMTVFFDRYKTFYWSKKTYK